MPTTYATSLFHACPDAPQGKGRALRAGDTVAYHDIMPSERFGTTSAAQPSSGLRWVLLADPVRHVDGYYDAQSIERLVYNVNEPIRADNVYSVSFSSGSIVGCGPMKIVWDLDSNPFTDVPVGSALDLYRGAYVNACYGMEVGPSALFEAVTRRRSIGAVSAYGWDSVDTSV